jgi:preprotein translocase subunit SecG
MENVVLVIHLMLALAIIGLVLLQRSEGGGLGIGGGGMGGLATPQATANALTKATGFCAMCFFGTSLVLGILAGNHSKSSSLIDQIEDVAPASVSKEVEGIVPEISEMPQEPTVPIAE